MNLWLQPARDALEIVMHKERGSAGIWMLAAAFLCAGAPQTPAAATNFHIVPLGDFVNRLFSTYPATQSWGMVPRGATNFDGVPFEFTGKIDLTGLGRARDGEFQPPRVGEIPVRKRAARLHFIHGASYDCPDDTPIAELLLHYTHGVTRKLFIRYGVHVRNWYVERSEKMANVIDPRTTVVWRGNTSLSGNGTPLRLFKTTFDCPLPAQEIRALELATLFARANPVFVAFTLEETSVIPPANTTPDEDDSPYRREATFRVIDSKIGRPVPNVATKLRAHEGARSYGWGVYQSNTRGEIRIDYPPGKFMLLAVDMTAAGYEPVHFGIESENGGFGPDLPVRLIPEN